MENNDGNDTNKHKISNSFVSALPDDGEGEDEEVTELDDRGGAVDSDLDLNDDDDEDENMLMKKGNEPEQPLWVLPLYSMLPPQKQKLVSCMRKSKAVLGEEEMEGVMIKKGLEEEDEERRVMSIEMIL